MSKLKVIQYDKVPVEEFPGGAQYRTLVAEENGVAHVVTGIQISPPGYSTPNHSHPYVEIVTVMEGEADVWSEAHGETFRVGPGGTVIFPAHEYHGFRVVGEVALKTYGVHLSHRRIVKVHDVEDSLPSLDPS